MTWEMLACAIGARSQMARTYLERHLDEFTEASKEDLIIHGLRALKESLSQDKELTIDNTALSVVGKDPETGKLDPLKLYEGVEIASFLDKANESAPEQERAPEAPRAPEPQEGNGNAMEVDS
ncbi:hypothetical protein KEM55_004272 [Ascosphaera atra]|nr:hypothetical protein KEM55_004272 [Ascosphaera atra]